MSDASQSQNPATYQVVPLDEGHIPALLALFEQSVRQTGPEHYSPEQVEQWAQGASHPGLAAQLREHHGWVITCAKPQGEGDMAGEETTEPTPLGFVTLSDDGHLSLLYVSPHHQRQGLGGRLLETAMQFARRRSLPLLTTEASAFSLGLFLRHGFEQTGLETVERGGVSFIRHRLHCRLPSQG